MKPVRFSPILGLIVVLLLAAMTGYFFLRPGKLHGEIIQPPHPVPDFTLQSAKGPVSLEDFRGKVVVLYFGYTSCPDLCPITLATLRQATDALGKRGKDVQVAFISVDWKRDTPEIMEKYVNHFSPDFIGLSGSEAQINAVTQSFGVFYLLNLPDENGSYSVDHTASMMVLDRQGNLKVIWPYGIQPAEMTSDLKILLKDKSGGVP